MEDKPKVEILTSNGIELEKTTYPDGKERVVILDKPKLKSNPKKDVQL